MRRLEAFHRIKTHNLALLEWPDVVVDSREGGEAHGQQRDEETTVEQRVVLRPTDTRIQNLK